MSNTTNLPAATVGFQLFVEITPYADLLPGGKEVSTCWQDFCIANHWQTKAVRDTFDRIWADFKHDIRIVTELSFATNYMSWRFDDAFKKSGRKSDKEMRDLYIELYEKVNDWVYGDGKVSEADRSYFFQATD